MTELSTMLDFFSPDVDYVYTYCAECGTPLSVNRQATKRPLCPDCKREVAIERDRRRNADRTPYRYGDPVVDLVGAIIRQAEHDAAWHTQRCPDGSALDISECDVREFIADNGVELLLKALGIGVRREHSLVIQEMREY